MTAREASEYSVYKIFEYIRQNNFFCFLHKKNSNYTGQFFWLSQKASRRKSYNETFLNLQVWRQTFCPSLLNSDKKNHSLASTNQHANFSAKSKFQNQCCGSKYIEFEYGSRILDPDPGLFDQFWERKFC